MRLAHAGKEVCLVEKRSVGGQCLHERCMAVCALNDVARLVDQSRMLRDLGVIESVPAVSFPALLAGMRRVQERIGAVLDAETRQAGVEIRYGAEGRVDGRRVFIGGEEASADAVIIATGSRPAIPAIPGTDLAGVYTYQNLQAMPAIPARLVIIGGGVMAAEFAHIFSAFGSDVHILARSTFLSNFDGKMRAAARKDLAGVTISEGARVSGIEGAGAVRSVIARTEEGEAEIEADAVLLAAGLIPCSGAVSGLQKGPQGEVLVDDRMRTSVEGVYAAGDVIGPPYLTPVARQEGVVAADNILGRERRMDYSAVPQAMSLSNEYAFCTRGGGAAPITLSAPAPAGPGSFWSVPFGATGMAQVRVDPETGQLVGAAAAVPGASLLISYLAYLMKRGCTVADFEEFIEIHPSTDGIYGLIRYTSEWLKKRG